MTPEDVLRQYPGPISLEAPRALHVALPACCALCCCILLFSPDYRVRAVSVVFGGFSLLYALANYLRPATLELTGWGFVIKDCWGLKTKYRWTDVSTFGVGWGRLPAVQFSDRTGRDRLNTPTRMLTIPAPFPAEQMATLMNAWRERSIGS